VITVLRPPSLNHLEVAVVAFDRERERHDPVARLDHRQDALDSLLPILQRAGHLFHKVRLHQLRRPVIVEFYHGEEAGTVLGIV